MKRTTKSLKARYPTTATGACFALVGAFTLFALFASRPAAAK